MSKCQNVEMSKGQKVKRSKVEMLKSLPVFFQPLRFLRDLTFAAFTWNKIIFFTAKTQSTQRKCTNVPMCKCTNDSPLRFLRDLIFAAFARNKIIFFTAKTQSTQVFKNFITCYLLHTAYFLLFTFSLSLSLSLCFSQVL